MEVTVDIVDTYNSLWGWISAESFTLAGSCAGQNSTPQHVQGQRLSHSQLPEVCHLSDAAGFRDNFVSAEGPAWNWQSTRFGGGLVNSEVHERDWQHASSIFRSKPFRVSLTTSIGVLTRGGRGARTTVDGQSSHVGGATSHDGFLGVAIRVSETDQWAMSKRRVVSSQDDDELISWESSELDQLVGLVVTVDIVDTFHGWWGWLCVRKFTLHGTSCPDDVQVQTNEQVGVHAGLQAQQLEFSTSVTSLISSLTTTSMRPSPNMTTSLFHTSTSSTAVTSVSTSRKKRCATKRSQAKPSLYCFSVMTAHEVQLITEQYKRRASIFACNDFNVISSIPMSVGQDECGDEVYTWLNKVAEVPLGNVNAGAATSSFLNTKTFILAWDTLLAGGKVPKYDWVVKVDPDCVFFPERLRDHLRPYTGRNVFVKNCDLYGGTLYGALEAFSEAAIDNYQKHVHECKEMQWRQWGEDLYMSNCLQSKGVETVTDFHEVGDARCKGAACTDASVAAYHPFKDPGSYWSCWNQSPK